jgi:Phage integrase family
VFHTGARPLSRKRIHEIWRRALSKEVPCPQWANELRRPGSAQTLGQLAGQTRTPHDLRHFHTSALIRPGADVKLVQARLGHKSAQTTIDIYGHLWPDSDERSRTAIDAVFDKPLARTVDGDAGTAAETGLWVSCRRCLPAVACRGRCSRPPCGRAPATRRRGRKINRQRAGSPDLEGALESPTELGVLQPRRPREQNEINHILDAGASGGPPRRTARVRHEPSQLHGEPIEAHPARLLRERNRRYLGRRDAGEEQEVEAIQSRHRRPRPRSAGRPAGSRPGNARHALADFIETIGLRWIANTKPPRSAACALRKSAVAASWSSLRPRSTSLVVLVPGPSR